MDKVKDFGEVLTPAWLVESMLNQVPQEAVRYDSKILETACGDGNFLIQIVEKRIEAAKKMHKSDRFNLEQTVILSLMSIYGIELQAENVEKCHHRIRQLVKKKMRAKAGDDFLRGVEYVLSKNIVQGDALTMKFADGTDIILPEWSYIGMGKFNRRDFSFPGLIRDKEGKIIPQAVKSYPPMRISELSNHE